jgi:hypothetical protein
MIDKRWILILPFFFFSLRLSAYTERDLLQKAANLETVKKVMITGQKWVPYPAYSDRSAWEEFLGENKAGFIRNMGEYIVSSYVGDGWVVNFADASAKGGGNAPLIFRYGKAIGSPLMTQHAAYLEKQQRKNNIRIERDIFRSLQTLKYQKELENEKPAFRSPAYTWYPETEFCYMSNAQGLFLAAKGGFNEITTISAHFRFTGSYHCIINIVK